MLEQELLLRWKGKDFVIVRGVMNAHKGPNTAHKGMPSNDRLLDLVDDEGLAHLLTHARHIVCRSGYSTIMDLDALRLLNHPGITLQLIPTPGQPEQKYLAMLHRENDQQCG